MFTDITIQSECLAVSDPSHSSSDVPRTVDTYLPLWHHDRPVQVPAGGGGGAVLSGPVDVAQRPLGLLAGAGPDRAVPDVLPRGIHHPSPPHNRRPAPGHSTSRHTAANMSRRRADRTLPTSLHHKPTLEREGERGRQVRDGPGLTLSSSSWPSDVMLGSWSEMSSRAASVVASLVPLTLLEDLCSRGERDRDVTSGERQRRHTRRETETSHRSPDMSHGKHKRYTEFRHLRKAATRKWQDNRVEFQPLRWGHTWCVLPPLKAHLVRPAAPVGSPGASCRPRRLTWCVLPPLSAHLVRPAAPVGSPGASCHPCRLTWCVLPPLSAHLVRPAAPVGSPGASCRPCRLTWCVLPPLKAHLVRPAAPEGSPGASCRPYRLTWCVLPPLSAHLVRPAAPEGSPGASCRP